MRELQFIDYGGLTRLGWFGLSREEIFPEETEEEQRINGRFKKFKTIDEISEEDLDCRPDFQYFVQGAKEEPEEEIEPIDELDKDDVFYDYFDYDDLDPNVETEIFSDTIMPDEKEKIDKKLSLSKFIPFTKIKRKL